MTDLSRMKCEPCEGGTKPFEVGEAEKYLSLLKTKWDLDDRGSTAGSERILRIRKKFKFEDFNKAMQFVNRIADIAQEQGHHPDIFISYNRVTITLFTHSIGGLSVNDFILASRIDLIQIQILARP